MRIRFIFFISLFVLSTLAQAEEVEANKQRDDIQIYCLTYMTKHVADLLLANDSILNIYAESLSRDQFKKGFQQEVIERCITNNKEYINLFNNDRNISNKVSMKLNEAANLIYNIIESQKQTKSLKNMPTN